MSGGEDELATLPPHPRCTHRAYALTCKEFDDLRARAGGRCEICGTGAEGTPRGMLFIDHDPLLGRWAVRGLLCNSCNTNLTLKSQPDTPKVRRYLANPWRRTKPVRRYQSTSDVRTRLTGRRPPRRPGPSGEMAQALERITELGRQHRQTKAALERIRPELEDEICRAADGGVPQKEISELVGLTRESIRQICHASARRRHLASRSRRPGED